MPKPIIPLTHASTMAYRGSDINDSNLLVIPKHNVRTKPVNRQRTAFAEIGFAFNNAFLYNNAEKVQQIAAPKAASSPIILFTQLWEDY